MGIGDLSGVARAGENLAEEVPALRRAVETVADTFHGKALAEVISDGSAPVSKGSHVLPEAAFQSLTAQDQMLSALYLAQRPLLNGASSPLQRILEKRAPQLNIQPDQILPSLFSASWKPVPLRCDRVFAYHATVPGVASRADFTPLDSIGPDAKLHLTLKSGWFGVSAEAPSFTTDLVRAIVAKDGETGGYSLVDLRPGAREPSMIDNQTLSTAIEKAGMAVPFRPQGLLGSRLEITREQLVSINKQLPPEARLTVAIMESPGPYRPAALVVSADQEAGLLKPLDGAPLSERELRNVRRLTMRLYDPKDGERYERLLSGFPERLRYHFSSRLNSVTRNPSELDRTVQMQSLLFEMSRLDRTIKQGLETVPTPGTGLSEKKIWHPRRKIEVDVPIVRAGNQPYVVETKSFSKRGHGNGSTRDTVEQLRKYQHAIDIDAVAGTTLETTGMLAPKFLNLIRAEAAGTSNKIPNVEVLHTIPLPSGAEYTFPLKPLKDGSGLRYFNNESAYTAQDWRVVDGARNANSDRSIDQILTKHNIDSAPADLLPYVGNATPIPNSEVLRRYEQLRLQALWDKLAAKSS